MKLMKFVALLAFAGSSQAITIDQANNQLVEASTAVLSLSFTDRMMNDTEKYPDGLRWNHTPSEIKELGTEIITEFNAGLTKLINVKGPRTFKNTIEPLNKFESALNTKSTPIQFYTQVSDKKEVREAAKVFEKQISEFQTDMWMREDLYKVIKSYKDNADKDGSFKKLDKESQRYVNKTLQDFEDSGMKLSAEERKVLVQLQKEISELEQKGEANINEDKSKMEFSVAELKGVPQENIDKLEKVEGKPDFRIVHLDKKVGGPMMRYLDNAETRKKLNFALENVGKQNVPIINELSKKRHLAAQMLNYSSFADLTLEPRMAHSIKNVEKLLDGLTHKITNLGRKEHQKIVDFKRTFPGMQEANFETWDNAYYMSRYNEKFAGFNEKELAKYFPAEHVKNATMEIYQELLGLKFKKLEKAQTWNKLVSVYEVRDKESNKKIGNFYLDLYPREDKFNHAAAMTLLKRAKVDNKTQLASAAMVTNFSPGKSASEPSVLPHSEVVTFFHEFGHVMHNMCNEAKYDRFSGAQVEKDFVEMPSQMLENWIWQKDILKKVSKHVKTGKPLPDDLIAKKVASQNMHVASETLGQIFLASIDLILNSAYDKNMLKNQKLIQAAENLKKKDAAKNGQSLTQFLGSSETIGQFRSNIKMDKENNIDTGILYHTLSRKIQSENHQEGTNPIGNIGHLISGYVASYYSYLWAQVYSSDLFAKFQKEGLMNKELGMKYRKEILAPGGTRDSMESLKIFLGREPNDKAFMKQNGFDKDTSE